jgi:hypothetical protein
VRTDGGWSLPLLPILILVLAVLTWFFGWIVPVVAVALFLAIGAGTAVYDRLTHAKRCRWCNRIKSVLEEERGLAPERITTRHVRSFDTHMLVQVCVDGRRDVLVDIDYNERILGTD